MERQRLQLMADADRTPRRAQRLEPLIERRLALLVSHLSTEALILDHRLLLPGRSFEYDRWSRQNWISFVMSEAGVGLVLRCA